MKIEQTRMVTRAREEKELLSVFEFFVSWVGQGFSASPGPEDTLELRHNRLSFLVCKLMERLVESRVMSAEELLSLIGLKDSSDVKIVDD